MSIITIYNRLTGVSPFGEGDIQEILERNKICEIDFPKSLWGNISQEALDLVISMTNKDQYQRRTAREYLEHKWFSLKFRDNEPLNSALFYLFKNERK